MEAKDAPDGETAAPYEPSPDGTRAKSMVAALQLDTQECLDRLDDLDARLGVDRGKVHEEYINSVRASVTTYVKRVEANASVSADAGRGLSDLDAPSEALALLGAALLTLLAEGDTIPSDVRWPAVVAFVDADPDAALGAARAALRSYFNLSI